MKCGVGDYTARLVENIAPLTKQVNVITTDDSLINQGRRFKAAENVRILKIMKKWNFPSAFRLIKKIRELDPGVVHIQYHFQTFNHGILKGLMITMLPFFLKQAGLKVKITVTSHTRLEGPYLFRGAGFLRQSALKLMYLFSDKIILTNRYEMKELIERFGFARQKAIYIAGGTGFSNDKNVKPDEIRLMRNKIKQSDDEIVICNFGYMVPHKGLEEFFRAVNILRKKGYRIRILAIGGRQNDIESRNNNYVNQLDKTLDELNLKPYVSWTGYCETPKASLFLYSADICVMPFVEGSSELRSSLMCALSHQLPIVTTHSERTPIEFVDHKNMLLTSPHDYQSLANAIEELIKFPELRAKLAEAAGQLYQKNYSWPIIARKTYQAYIS